MTVQLPFNPDKIAWENRENDNGQFQMSEDYSNPEFKALLRFLNELAGGRIHSEGWFYWVYRNGSTIGRKWKGNRNNHVGLDQEAVKLRQDLRQFHESLARVERTP